MHWLRHFHDQPHSLPHDCPKAGAQWTPNVQEYGRNRPPFPVMYSDEEKQEQYAAGDRLREDFNRAIREGGKGFTIAPGIYRSREPLVIENTEDFVLEAADVEFIVEDGSHFRILGNRNLTVRGHFVLDADPLGWTQGEIIELNQAEMTIDAQLFEGYAMPTKGERIEIFTPEGLMLPHGQDAVQEFIDLGGGVLRVKMNPWTWGQHAEHADDILRRGNLLAVEIGGKGGLEMRGNTGTTWEDVALHSHGLTWAMPELGEDRFVRWNGSRRRDTNRLVGGGFPLMTFRGGAYTLIDSEIGHNFDDITDINTFQSFGFEQVGPRQFHIMSSEAQVGWPITLHDYRTMECYCECEIHSIEDAQDTSVREKFKALAEKYNVRDLDEAKLCTISCDVEIPEFSWISLVPAKTRRLRFERNYLHDGLAAGIAAKGADEVIIKDNIIERVAGIGIGVCFDPYWWEGNPSRNIQIVGNTVRNCPYIPTNDTPAIAVFVGGSYAGMPGPDATAQLQEGIVIANNAVFSAGGTGISVTNSRDIQITENVITDSQVSGFAKGSIYLNAVSKGTQVMGNVFAGADASTEAVQIKTGPLTDPRSVSLDNNRASNPEVPVPSTPWQFHAVTEPGFEFSGEGWWEEQEYPAKRKASRDREATLTYSFSGLRVRVISPRAKWAGIADAFVDDQYAGTIDMSGPGDEVIGPCWASPILPQGEHHVRLVNRAESGRHTDGDGGILAVAGLDILHDGLDSWQWDPHQGPRA